ncbi:porin [Psychromonas sp. KJ10-10]|uniref:porin n=1 Tax=Psychromonas sp. KJ10-10 TaxID=3391823 RepID=UPI0039B4229C
MQLQHKVANIYDADGMTVDVSGGVEIMYGNTDDTDQDSIKIDDADLNFSLAYDLGNDVTAVGYFETDSGKDSVDAGNVYVGFSHATAGTLTVGKQDTIFDDAGIFSDHEIGIDSGVSQTTSSTQVIKYTFDTGMFYGGVAYLMNKGVSTEDDDSVIDGKIGVIVEDFDLTLYAGQEDFCCWWRYIKYII